MRRIAVFILLAALATFGACNRRPVTKTGSNATAVVKAIRVKKIPLNRGKNLGGIASKERYEFVLVQIQPLKAFSTAEIELLVDGVKAEQVGVEGFGGDIEAYAWKSLRVPTPFEPGVLTYSSGATLPVNIAFLVPEPKGDQRLELRVGADGNLEPLKLKVDKRPGDDRSATQTDANRVADQVRGLLKRFVSTQGSGTELLSILRHGKDAVPTVVDVLEGRDTDMAAFVESMGGRGHKELTSHVRLAATVLGAMGWAQATGPMLRSLQSADSDATRAVIAAALLQLPQTPEIVEAYQATYARIDPASKIDALNPVRPFLLGSAALLLDPSIVPWALDQVRNSRAKEEPWMDVQGAGLTVAILLMDRRQMPDVRAAVNAAGSSMQTNRYKSAAAVLTECEEHVDCYLHKLQAAPGKRPDSIANIKAAYMLAILGTTETGNKIISVLPGLKDPESRYLALLAIEHLGRTDPKPTAAALERILVAETAANGGKPKDVNLGLRGGLVFGLEEVILRLRAK